MSPKRRLSTDGPWNALPCKRLLGSVVMPSLVRKFSSDEHAYIAIANLFANVLFPAILIVYL